MLVLRVNQKFSKGKTENKDFKMSLMKNLSNVLITGFVGLLLITSIACNREVDLKENEQLKEEVFGQILNDEELFMDFTRTMREDGNAMQWMRENQPMMQDFYGGKEMQNMMRGNPEMRQHMMDNMMQMMMDTTFMPSNNQMRQQMRQNLWRMMERDTSRMNPEMREQMLEYMRRMMVQDTIMQNQMQQMMRGSNMMRNN